jgi:hypothetical protein
MKREALRRAVQAAKADGRVLHVRSAEGRFPKSWDAQAATETADRLVDELRRGESDNGRR